MKNKEEIELEINNMEIDKEKMKIAPSISEERRSFAIFTQEQVINALKWVLE